jgi:IS4 transposase
LANAYIFVLSRHEKEGPAMPYEASVFRALIKPLSRRRFEARTARPNSDAYDKTFSSWDHLMALIFAQLDGAKSLRGVAAAWAANSHCHYHLGAGPIRRSTLSDANARRNPALFAETFADLAGLADRKIRQQGDAFVKLMDSSPIPLSTLHEARLWNGRIKGAKLHLVYDPDTDRPETAAVTPANVNDISFAHEIALRPGATYVFDKGYCSLAFWDRLHKAKAFFVTRPKKNAALKTIARRRLDAATIIETNVVSDEIVRHDSKNKHRIALGFVLRRITVRRDNAKPMQIISNDLTRPARDIAALYRRRWRIELLFRWIKQHLKIKRFLGRSENAVKLQIFAALIAYLLLRIAARTSRRQDIAPIRFAELVSAALFTRKPIARIHKPPPMRPAKTLAQINQNQLSLI